MREAKHKDASRKWGYRFRKEKKFWIIEVIQLIILYDFMARKPSLLFKNFYTFIVTPMKQPKMHNKLIQI